MLESVTLSNGFVHQLLHEYGAFLDNIRLSQVCRALYENEQASLLSMQWKRRVLLHFIPEEYCVFSSDGHAGRALFKACYVAYYAPLPKRVRQVRLQAKRGEITWIAEKIADNVRLPLSLFFIDRHMQLQLGDATRLNLLGWLRRNGHQAALDALFSYMQQGKFVLDRVGEKNVCDYTLPTDSCIEDVGPVITSVRSWAMLCRNLDFVQKAAQLPAFHNVGNNVLPVLDVSIYSGQLAMVQTVYRANPNVCVTSAFGLACSLGYFSIVKWLFVQCRHPDIVDPMCCTDTAPTVAVNLEHKKQFRDYLFRDTPLRSALASKHLDMIRWLLSLQVFDETGHASLFPVRRRARKYRLCRVVEWGPQSGVSARDVLDIVTRMLERKDYSACLDSVGTSYTTPLFCACSLGYPAVVQYLIELHPASLYWEARSSNGLTPLACAVRGGQLETVKYLLSVLSSADAEVKVALSVTALDIALQSKMSVGKKSRILGSLIAYCGEAISKQNAAGEIPLLWLFTLPNVCQGHRDTVAHYLTTGETVMPNTMEDGETPVALQPTSQMLAMFQQLYEYYRENKNKWVTDPWRQVGVVTAAWQYTGTLLFSCVQHASVQQAQQFCIKLQFLLDKLAQVSPVLNGNYSVYEALSGYVGGADILLTVRDIYEQVRDYIQDDRCADATAGTQLRARLRTQVRTLRLRLRWHRFFYVPARFVLGIFGLPAVLLTVSCVLHTYFHVDLMLWGSFYRIPALALGLCLLVFAGRLIYHIMTCGYDNMHFFYRYPSSACMAPLETALDAWVCPTMTVPLESQQNGLPFTSEGP